MLCKFSYHLVLKILLWLQSIYSIYSHSLHVYLSHILWRTNSCGLVNFIYSLQKNTAVVDKCRMPCDWSLKDDQSHRTSAGKRDDIDSMEEETVSFQGSLPSHGAFHNLDLRSKSDVVNYEKLETSSVEHENLIPNTPENIAMLLPFGHHPLQRLSSAPVAAGFDKTDGQAAEADCSSSALPLDEGPSSDVTTKIEKENKEVESDAIDFNSTFGINCARIPSENGERILSQMPILKRPSNCIFPVAKRCNHKKIPQKMYNNFAGREIIHRKISYNDDSPVVHDERFHEFTDLMVKVNDSDRMDERRK